MTARSSNKAGDDEGVECSTHAGLFFVEGTVDIIVFVEHVLLYTIPLIYL